MFELRNDGENPCNLISSSLRNYTVLDRQLLEALRKIGSFEQKHYRALENSASLLLNKFSPFAEISGPFDQVHCISP